MKKRKSKTYVPPMDDKKLQKLKKRHPKTNFITTAWYRCGLLNFIDDDKKF